jgi:predicted Zn-dependent protease with MMP-like domain
VSDEDADERWEQLAEAIALGEFDRAEALIDDLADDYGDDDPELAFERIVLIWERDGPISAIAPLDELLRREPEHADAHYLRGLACDELDDQVGMVEHFMQVLELDAELADEQILGEPEELDFIENTAEQVLARVPDEFRAFLHNVPIVLEPRPHPSLVREGFDPRSLGLFEGMAHDQLESGAPVTAPTRIVLYYANLLGEFPDRDDLADEIEITILHEIGHYFALDEDDLERLGLE